jgi:hypothetical protein
MDTSTRAQETADRVERFKREVAELQSRTSGGRGERSAGLAGAILMVLGPVLAIGSYVQATNQGVGRGTTNDILLAQMSQNQAIILASVGVALTLVGVTLFLRSALLRFWRFWMLRHLYESRAQLDEVLAEIRAWTQRS